MIIKIADAVRERINEQIDENYTIEFTQYYATTTIQLYSTTACDTTLISRYEE